MSKILYLVVPCYNEEAALHYYYKEMSRVMDEMNDVYCLRYPSRAGHALSCFPASASEFRLRQRR